MTTASTMPLGSSGRAARIGLWTLQIVGAAAFLAAGGAKLAGVPAMVEVFDHIGVGQWFRYVTGAVEVAGAVMLLVPRLAGVGGLLLATTMFFAAATHLFVIGGSPVGAIALFAITAAVAWFRRAALLSLIGR